MNPKRAEKIRETYAKCPFPVVLGYDTREDPQGILDPSRAALEGEEPEEYLRGPAVELEDKR